jgi:hypothetical protein
VPKAAGSVHTTLTQLRLPVEATRLLMHMQHNKLSVMSAFMPACRKDCNTATAMQSSSACYCYNALLPTAWHVICTEEQWLLSSPLLRNTQIVK